ncbi:hypothetical protein [Criblamydia sequanensis]|uniref:Secreted protein n=1 Tax=Candidatus Criblamydia sequanensis CRIB-18 TaxID=1437425 RepID=A0A090D262_9BACT|nr:hypothetical protein [Criblamydia sequanensis]CDR34355.1 putative secreted protein [Criblamydia sequanensis CRIB-18]
MSSSKKWVYLFLINLLLMLGLVASLNFAFDPFLYFGREKPSPYPLFDEREQKINFLLNHKETIYGALLIGSSRIASLDADYFKEKTLNLGCSGLSITEYFDLLQFALKTLKTTPQKVYLGLDFGQIDERSMKLTEIKKILEKRQKFVYFLNPLLSFEASLISLKKLFGQENGLISLTDSLSRIYKELDEKEKEAKINHQLKAYKNRRLEIQNFQELHFKEKLKALIQNFPEIEFQVFTTPETARLFKEIKSSPLLQVYKSWLKELVSLFEKIKHIHFFGLSPEEEFELFFDAHHLNPKKSQIIIDILEKSDEEEKLFQSLTLKNIDSFMRERL